MSNVHAPIGPSSHRLFPYMVHIGTLDHSGRVPPIWFPDNSLQPSMRKIPLHEWLTLRINYRDEPIQGEFQQFDCHSSHSSSVSEVQVLGTQSCPSQSLHRKKTRKIVPFWKSSANLIFVELPSIFDEWCPSNRGFSSYILIRFEKLRHSGRVPPIWFSERYLQSSMSDAHMTTLNGPFQSGVQFLHLGQVWEIAPFWKSSSNLISVEVPSIFDEWSLWMVPSNHFSVLTSWSGLRDCTILEELRQFDFVQFSFNLQWVMLQRSFQMVPSDYFLTLWSDLVGSAILVKSRWFCFLPTNWSLNE